ncbi:hypothetical protein EV426DRAFT_712090 [Tirmania nivea]|nr:hypothetical protein EV426DRAFT_712090 [Tirmania nivea]
MFRTGRQKRRALTILEKHQICKKRQDPKHAKEKLSEFGKHFLDSEGQAVPISTLSDILRDSKKWLEVDLTAGHPRKKKQRTSQYPILEQYLIEWVDRANQKHISINDFVLLITTERLIAKLEALPSHPEQDIKEKVFERILEYLNFEEYPTEASVDFKEFKVNDLALYVIGPILLDLTDRVGRNIRLEREKEIMKQESLRNCGYRTDIGYGGKVCPNHRGGEKFPWRGVKAMLFVNEGCQVCKRWRLHLWIYHNWRKLENDHVQWEVSDDVQEGC